MAKYLNDSSVLEIINSVEKIIEIRNVIYKNHEIDILETDTISLTKFFGIIRSIDPNYNCNYSRNGEDGKTLFDNKEIKIETKTSKINKGKASFAFHAKGLINHDLYIFNVWHKENLTPLRTYYVRTPTNVKKLNDTLQNLSEEWQRKPATKAGYDVIRIHENLLESMIEKTETVNGCKVHYL